MKVFYSGSGARIVREFYIPVLKRSSEYNRLSGYFSISSLAITAAGLAGLIENGGKMKLIVGAHDLGPDVVKAYEMSKERAKDALDEISERIATGLDTVENVLQKERLKALAWMLANDTLEIRVAIPKKGYPMRGNGIFHEKVLIMKDSDGCAIQAVGSANETYNAYALNGESLVLHMSWKEGAQEYIDGADSIFKTTWDNTHPDYYTFSMPEAINKKLHERFYQEHAPTVDPEERSDDSIETLSRLLPAARLINNLVYLKEFTHLGLGPVRLYPHQAFAADFVTSRIPHRCLLADEVGLGKTLEAGAIIKRLINARHIRRVLILTPKNVARQWQDEMLRHFGIEFWLFESSPGRKLVSPDGNEVPIPRDGSPFSHPGVERVIASWHYARRDKGKKELLSSSPAYDLVIVDEAHAARKKRSEGKVEPTKLNELCMELSITTPHLILLSATPVQLRAVEAHDLLRILGLGGQWVHAESFEQYYEILLMEPPEVTARQWRFALSLARDLITRCIDEDDVKRLVEGAFDQAEDRELIYRMLESERELDRTASKLGRSCPERLCGFLMSLNPLQWFMVRNTRSRLTKQGFNFPRRNTREEEVELGRYADLLKRLDDYLTRFYGKYEKRLSPQNKGTIGFVRCIYHQRFVSSFSAAYQTMVNRKEFLEAILNRDMDAVRRVAEKILLDEEWEGDEDDLVDAMEELLDDPKVEADIQRELDEVERLRSELEPFNVANLTSDDPKLKALARVLADHVGNKGRKAIVFSKYTDTIDAVHKYIRDVYFSPEEIGLYTGAGGQVYDTGKGDYTIVSKEDVRKEFEGHVNILLCTEAAREGLNLQAASVVVNLDMPWNPALVEQRIGRADRLGQKADVVFVVNVWYPDTIEARMYKALFERKEIYEFVVGPAQEIFSENMRRALDEDAQGDRLRQLAEDTIARIDEMKETTARMQGALSGAAWEGAEHMDQQVVEQLISFLSLAGDALGFSTKEEDAKVFVVDDNGIVPSDVMAWNGASIEEGRPNALTPAHPIVQWASEEIMRRADEAGVEEPDVDRSYYIVLDLERIGKLIEIDTEGTPEELDGEGVLGALDGLTEIAGGDAE